MPFDFSTIHEVVSFEDPNGFNSDYPEQPEPYGTAVLVPLVSGYQRLIENNTVVSTFQAAGWGTAGGLHSDGTFIQRRHKFSADGTSVTTDYLQTTAGSFTAAVYPRDLALDANGRLWGADGQRAITVWNSDGTIWREFNTYATPGTTIPDGPRGITFHNGLLYLTSYDGIWVTDPNDPANIVDQWPERPAGWPGDYELHFKRLVLISYPDDGSYYGGIAVDDSRVYYTDTGKRATGNVSARILSCATTGIDQIPAVEFAPTTFETGASPFGFTGLRIIGSDLYVAGHNVYRLFRFAGVKTPECWNWIRVGQMPDTITGDRAQIIALTADKVFYASNGGTSRIRSAAYPALTSLNTKNNNDGLGFYTYETEETAGITRTVWGITIGPAGKLYVLVEKDETGNSAGEMWVFDTANPNDPGTIVATYPDSPGADGTMRGHIAYNSVDGRIYCAETHTRYDPNIGEYYASLLSFDLSTWERTTHARYISWESGSVRGTLTVASDGGVWYSRTWDPLVRYDPNSGTLAEKPAPLALWGSFNDPFPLNDGSVLGYSGAAGDDPAYRYFFNGTAIVEERFAIADVPDSFGGWAGVYGGQNSAWGTDGVDQLWTYDTICTALGGPTVGFIGFGTF